MSRGDGFAIMDVSTSIVNDPKVKKLWRHAPDHAATAFVAYLATMAESWAAGRRVNIDDAWPAYLPFSKPAIEALVFVELLEPDGLLPHKAWNKWHKPAHKRRTQARARWARYNAKRTGNTTDLPRGNDVSTATSVPSVPTVPSEEDISPPTPSRGGRRADGTNPRSVAARAREERKRQINAIRSAYYNGEITEAERDRRLEALR